MTRVTAILLLVLSGTLACGGGPSQPSSPTPRVVTTSSIPGIENFLDAGIQFFDWQGGTSGALSLEEASAELKASGIDVTIGARTGAAWYDNNGNHIPHIYPDRLVWVVSADPTNSTVPDLFPPTATTTLAVIDAREGTVQTVYTR